MVNAVFEEKKPNFPLYKFPKINAFCSHSGVITSKVGHPRKIGNYIPLVIDYFKNKPDSILFIWQYVPFNKQYWSNAHQHHSSLLHLLKELPNIKIVLCCNDKRSCDDYPKHERLTSILCNHNATVDRNIFSINDNERKIWDCVYTATIRQCKRHDLSYNIDNILYLASPRRVGKNYQELFNDLVAKQKNNYTLVHQHMQPEDMNMFYNKSKVGLCLSSHEGAMYSSVEYLLCGLPVVSTKSEGGRDTFFTEDNCIIAEDNPENIAECVRAWTQNYPSLEQRKKIRGHAVALQKTHTKSFILKLKEFLYSQGIDLDVDKLYSENFQNKMCWGRGH